MGKEYKPDTESMIVDSDKIPDDYMGLDIGPKTAELFAEAIKGAGTIIWNGPMGVSEWENFAHGTIAVAKRSGRVGSHLHHRRRRLGSGSSVAGIRR